MYKITYFVCSNNNPHESEFIEIGNFSTHIQLLDMLINANWNISTENLNKYDTSDIYKPLEKHRACKLIGNIPQMYACLNTGDGWEFSARGDRFLNIKLQKN